MAPRPDQEEIFTDLNGQPDGEPGADEAQSLERQLVALGQTDGIEDDDLEVVDAEDAEDGEEGQAEEEEGEEEGEAETATAAADDFDPKDVEILVAQAATLDEREKSAKTAETQATTDIATARTALKAAKEAGDTDADIAATDAYTKATIALENAKALVAKIGGQKAQLTDRAKDLYAKAPKDGEGNPILDKASVQTRQAAGKKDQENRPSKLIPKFKAANTWFDNAKYKKQRDRLVQIDRGLAAEGTLSKDDPAYFVELGKRFNREHPGLYKTLDGKPVATGERRRASGTPIPGGGGGGATPRTPASQVKLTTADLAEMRKFQMDPENMDHRRSWLAEKRASANVGA